MNAPDLSSIELQPAASNSAAPDDPAECCHRPRRGKSTDLTRSRTDHPEKQRPRIEPSLPASVKRLDPQPSAWQADALADLSCGRRERSSIRRRLQCPHAAQRHLAPSVLALASCSPPGRSSAGAARRRERTRDTGPSAAHTSRTLRAPALAAARAEELRGVHRGVSGRRRKAGSSSRASARRGADFIT